MSDSETTAPAHTAYGGKAVVIVNSAAWLLAFLFAYLAPEHIAGAVTGASVLSGTIGGGWASTHSLKNAGITALAGIVSTMLLLSLYVPLTGFRIGTAVGGIGTSFEAILSLTAFYILMFLFIFAVESVASWLGRKRNMHKAEHD